MNYTHLISSKFNNYTKTQKNSLMMGHWCATYEPGKKLKKYKILEHPWINRYKFENDYYKIENIYENSLKTISKILNKEFNLKYSLKFWRILIGPWLHCFMGLLYEKWILLNRLKKIKRKIKLSHYNFNKKKFISRNFKDHILLSTTDEWNDYLLIEIIKNSAFKNYITFVNKKYKKNKIFKIKKNFKAKETASNLKDSISKLYSNLFGFIKKKQSVVIFDTYLGKSKNIYLFLKNFQFAKAFYPINFTPSEPNMEKRENIAKLINHKSSLENFFTYNALMNLPTEYFEDFQNIKKKFLKLNLPRKPKVIFTANGLYQDSIQSRYTAESIENGAKLLIAQHGGKYGHFKVSFTDSHEINISDFFISWGWKKNKNKKIKNLGIVKNYFPILREKDNDANRKLLLFLMENKPRYIKYLTSDTGTDKYYEYYYNFCPNFIKELNNNLRDSLVVKTVKAIYGWNEIPFLKSKFSKINSVNGTGSYNKLVNESKLVICSYLSTSFLETLTANVPTILILSDSTNMFNKETLKFLKILKKEHIYFTNYKAAAYFINNNWYNVNKWWGSNNTQRAKNIFVENFSKKNENLVTDIQRLIVKLKTK